jgi:hypothetical protein
MKKIIMGDKFLPDKWAYIYLAIPKSTTIPFGAKFPTFTRKKNVNFLWGQMIEDKRHH